MFYNAFYEVINCNIVNQENLKQSGCALYIAKKLLKKHSILLKEEICGFVHYNEYFEADPETITFALSIYLGQCLSQCETGQFL